MIRGDLSSPRFYYDLGVRVAAEVELRFLYGVLLLVLVGFLFLNRSVLTYVRDPETSPLGGKGSPAAMPRPQRFSGMHSPHAILILDVSASMKTSDPNRFQAEATLQFVRLYRDLSAEVLRKGEHPRLAVVLFATLAQTIDWRGNGDPWLELTDASEEAVKNLAELYLGGDSSDTRAGQDTDYLAAIAEVSRLAKDLPSPPVVLFMTDGLYDPHPLFSPIVPFEERQRLASGLGEKAAAAVVDAEKGKYRLLRLSGTDRLFDTRLFGVDRMKLPPAYAAKTPDAIREARTALLSRRYPWPEENRGVCLLWAPVFLGPMAHAAEHDVSSVLSSETACGPWKSHVAFLRDPKDLASEFGSALGEWFRLHEQPLLAGARSLQLPSDTRSFAMLARTERNGSRFVMTSDTTTVPLVGRGAQWAGVGRGGGTWSFKTDGGSVAGGRLFIRPRYVWALRSPEWLRTAGKSDNLEIDLFLLSTEDGNPVDAGKVYSNLPAEIPIRVTPPSGSAFAGVMTRSAERKASGEEVAPAYRGRVAIGQTVTFGRAKIAADLSPLAGARIPLSTPSIFADVDIRPSFRIRLQDPSGKETRLNVGNVPREGAWLRRILTANHAR
jgi:hypothetical protein